MEYGEVSPCIMVVSHQLYPWIMVEHGPFISDLPMKDVDFPRKRQTFVFRPPEMGAERASRWGRPGSVLSLLESLGEEVCIWRGGPVVAFLIMFVLFMMFLFKWTFGLV